MKTLQKKRDKSPEIKEKRTAKHRNVLGKEKRKVALCRRL